MAIPNPKILDQDLNELAVPLTFDGLPGGRSNVQTLHIVNNPGGIGAEPLRGAVLRVLEREAGESVWNSTGRPLVDGRRIEARIVSGLGGLPIASGPWEPIGAGRPLELPEIPNDQGIQLELSLVLPLDTPAVQTELHLGLADQRITVLEHGHTESVGDGLYLGLGDGLTTELAHGGQVTANSPEDDQVQIGGAGWIAAGEPHYVPPTTIQLDSFDASSDPVTPGHAYWAVLVLDPEGSVQVLKSDQSPEPLDLDDAPPPPSGSIALARIQRTDSATITDADIEPLAEPAAATFTAQGLTARIGPSRGLVDNRWWVHQVAETLALPANATTDLWRLPGGDLTVTTDGTRPDPRALLLHQVETNATEVISHKSRSRFLGRQDVLRFVFAEPLRTGIESQTSWPHEAPGRISPIPGHLTVQLFDIAGTAGATQIDLEVLPEGTTTWQSLFPSGTLPTVPFDAQTDSETLPELLTLPPRSLLRARVVTETETAWPSGAVVSLIVNY